MIAFLLFSLAGVALSPFVVLYLIDRKDFHATMRYLRGLLKGD